MTWKARFFVQSFSIGFFSDLKNATGKLLGFLWSNNCTYQRFDIKLEFGWTRMGLALIDQVTHLIPMLWRIPIWWNESCQKFRWWFWRWFFNHWHTVFQLQRKLSFYFSCLTCFTRRADFLASLHLRLQPKRFPIPYQIIAYFCVLRRNQQRRLNLDFLVFALNKRGALLQNRMQLTLLQCVP